MIWYKPMGYGFINNTSVVGVEEGKPVYDESKPTHSVWNGLSTFDTSSEPAPSMRYTESMSSNKPRVVVDDILLKTDANGAYDLTFMQDIDSRKETVSAIRLTEKQLVELEQKIARLVEDTIPFTLKNQILGELITRKSD